MPAPLKIIRSTRITLWIPDDKRAKLDLYLFSAAEGRVPKGAYTQFFSTMIDRFFQELPNANVPRDSGQDRNSPSEKLSLNIS